MATHKASKFFGKIGLGRKSKALPHQPKVDYGAQKSSSVQELLPKSPTSERSRAGVSLSATSSGISDFDNTVTVSPGHKTDKGSHGGARPKEPPGGGLSPKQSTSERHSMISYTDDVGILGPAATDGPPPQFVDEYSDPYDLKKQIVENPELSGACAQAPLVDDDYSVPYEVKKLMREMKLREVGDGARARASRKAEGQLYDEPYGEGPGRFSSSPTRYTGDTRDYRPRDDYDEPWEWSAKQRSLFFQTQIGAEASSQNMSGANQKGTPLMTKRTSQPAGVGAEADENDVGGEEVEGGGEKSPDGPDYVNAPRGHKRMQNHADEDEDEEGYTHLREEFGARGPAAPAETTKVNKTENNKVPVPAEIPVGNYEEPWDLSFTQKDLEDKLKAASDRASRLGTSSSGPVGDPAGASPQSQDPMPHETDLRPQEGYEKPWDWKPHKKDDRGEEGYEKPWDWKPHQKDDRPPEEYEEPWDQKVKDIERDLIKAKSAKEALKEREQTEDTRPMDEYDEPWDQKAAKNKALLSRTASDGSAKSGPCSGLAGAAAVDSPKRNARGNKANNESGWTAAAERVDPMLPLDQQGWYHGSISRVDAETLLRVHKEGSYLVRMSESNKLDFSLSLKSAQGFMHMKIVSRDSHFILGQFSQPFESIPQMIHHYSISKLPIKGAYHMSLLHPVINELL